MLIKKSISITVASTILLGLIVMGCGNAAKPNNPLEENNPVEPNNSVDPDKNIENKKISALTFVPIKISSNDDEKIVMRVSPKMTVTYDDNSTQAYDLSYKVLVRMGDKIGHGTIGLITDKEGNPILKSDGSKDISDGPDGNSLIHVGNKDYLITNLEEKPGAVYHTELKVENGELRAVDTKPVDVKEMGGTIINCASTRTRYGTHLGGEEDYSLNTRYADKESPFYIDCTGNKSNHFCVYVDAMGKYLGDNNIDKKNGYNGDSFSPYNYGYIVEVKPEADGTTKSAKHYVTGKYTPELAAMMPDGKTVYMSDDGTFKGFFKFVSDEKIEKFQSDWVGTLYAAKLDQTSNKNGGAFTITWIKLGHAKDSEIKAMIDKKPKLTDIFDIRKPDANGICSDGFKKINEDSQVECLKLTGKEKEAAFLETRKYAAYKDATIEFNKEESIAYDADKNVLYIAMSLIKKSMEDNYKGKETTNHIKLPPNKCGAVYELALDSSYSATSMKALVIGKPLNDGDAYANEWTCHPDAISNPDNMTYIGHHTLLISEDTPYHVNNMTWAYNTKNKTLTRITSLPIGAEITGVDISAVEGKGILLINTQHPFEDNPKALNGDKVNADLLTNATEEQSKAVIGYIDGIPAEVFK